MWKQQHWSWNKVCQSWRLRLTTMAQTNLFKLDRVQNEAMRVILGTTQDTPIETMRYMLHLPPMQTGQKVEQVKAYFSAVKNHHNPLHEAVKDTQLHWLPVQIISYKRACLFFNTMIFDFFLCVLFFLLLLFFFFFFVTLFMYNLLHFRNAKLLTYRDAHSSTYFRLRLCLFPLFEGFLQTVQAIPGSGIVLRTAKIHTNQTLTERITWQHGRYLWNATNKIQAPNYRVLRR